MKWHICDSYGASLREFQYKKQAVDSLKKGGYTKQRNQDVYVNANGIVRYLVHG